MGQTWRCAAPECGGRGEAGRPCAAPCGLPASNWQPWLPAECTLARHSASTAHTSLNAVWHGMPWPLQVDEGSLGEAGKNWPRPAAPQLNPATDKLGAFMRGSAVLLLLWQDAGMVLARCCIWMPWLLCTGCLAMFGAPHSSHADPPGLSRPAPSHFLSLPACSVPAAGGGLHVCGAPPHLLPHRPARGDRMWLRLMAASRAASRACAVQGPRLCLCLQAVATCCPTLLPVLPLFPQPPPRPLRCPWCACTA